MQKELIVSCDDQRKRLDKFLAQKLSFLSRTKIHNLICEEKVLVDAKVKKPSFHLHQGQKVCIIAIEKKKVLRPYKTPVKIVYEDNDIIVVDKPTGLTVHPPQEGYDKTLVNALLYLKKGLFKTGDLRPGVVHRLDKETSGIMVLTKNEAAHENLIEQFKKRKVKKEYNALVWGKLKKKDLVVNLPLARDSKNRLKMKVSFLASKDAYTKINAISVFDDSTLLSIKPLTGRMHQIRVHLKFLGFPIIGDKKYGVKDDYKELYLHAGNLGFRHPMAGNFLTFTSPLPKRFKEFLTKKNTPKL